MKRFMLLLLSLCWTVCLSSTDPPITQMSDTCLNLQVERVSDEACRLHWTALSSCEWYVVTCTTMQGELIFEAQTRLTHYLDLSDKDCCQFRYQVRACDKRSSGKVIFGDCGMVYTNCRA
ncbi:MAG: hypothetical protein AAFV95_15290 [Bacteroidota bacterium]